MKAIRCTYCWQSHYGFANIDNLIATLRCGPDRWRYFESRADYLAYIRQYEANDYKHFPLGGGVLSQLGMNI